MSIATLHIAFEPREASEKDERVYNSTYIQGHTSSPDGTQRRALGRPSFSPESIASCKSHRSWEETMAAAARRAVYTNIQTYTLICDGTKLKTFLVICVMDYTTATTDHNLRKINPDYIPASTVRGCWKCISTKSSFYYYFPPPYSSLQRDVYKRVRNSQTRHVWKTSSPDIEAIKAHQNKKTMGRKRMKIFDILDTAAATSQLFFIILDLIFLIQNISMKLQLSLPAQ